MKAQPSTPRPKSISNPRGDSHIGIKPTGLPFGQFYNYTPRGNSTKAGRGHLPQTRNVLKKGLIR